MCNSVYLEMNFHSDSIITSNFDCCLKFIKKWLSSWGDFLWKEIPRWVEMTGPKKDGSRLKKIPFGTINLCACVHTEATASTTLISLPLLCGCCKQGLKGFPTFFAQGRFYRGPGVTFHNFLCFTWKITTFKGPHVATYTYMNIVVAVAQTKCLCILSGRRCCTVWRVCTTVGSWFTSLLTSALDNSNNLNCLSTFFFF